MRQSENQRATLTNYVLILTAAMTGLITQQQFAAHTWPVAGVIAGAGLYGALTCAKYQERASYHLHQARVLTRALIDHGALPDLNEALTTARTRHARQHRWTSRLRLGRQWITLHLGITLLGIALLTMALT